MKVLFLANTGVHHGLIAANIFLGRPNSRDFRLIKGFGDSYTDRSGFPIYVGQTSDGIQVYTLGVERDLLMAKRTIEDLLALLGKEEKDLVLQPVTVSGEKIFLLLNKIPSFLGGQYINRWLSTYLLHKQYKNIRVSALNFKAHLHRRIMKHEL